MQLKPNFNPIGEALHACGVALPEKPIIATTERTTAHVRSAYIIVTTGRAGSTWLTAALNKIVGAGRPNEFFSEDGLKYFGDFSKPQDFSTHLHWLFANHQDDGIFGLKIDPQRLFFLEAFVDLHKTFSGVPCPWLDLRRWNIVKQAFSFSRARKSGRWHEFVDESRGGSSKNADRDLRITSSDVWADIKRILKAEQGIELYYLKRGIIPFRFYYEEIFDSRDHILLRVLRLIDPGRDWPDAATIPDQTRRISDSNNLEEMEFLNKYSSEINYIMNNRLTVDCASLP